MQGIARVARIAIVVTWVVLLTALLRSQLVPDDVTTAPAALDLALPTADEEVWMGVYMQDQKVGYTHTRLRPTDGGYRLEETSFLRLTVMDSVQTVRAAIDATAGRDYALRSFKVALDSGFGSLEVRGVAEPDALALHMRSAGGETDQRLPLRDPIYLPSAARAAVRAAGFVPGRAQAVQVFDPSAMQNHVMQVTVVGREHIAAGGATIEAWRVRESFRGIDATVWFDLDGRVVREEGPLGLVAVRESAADAMGLGWGQNGVDLMAAVAVPVERDVPDPRRLEGMTVRVRGLGDAAVPTDRRQSFREGVLVVQREPRVESTYTLPYREGEWQDDLRATPFLQSDHPRLRETAQAVIAGETDPRAAAERLRRWVYETLGKTPAATIPNALQVLDVRAGDCNEHAVLWAALARAVGLPARVVAGLVYADGAFLYHAWNEVWLGTAWVSVDPAFDQMPADATHVKLVEGGPEAHAALVSVIGRLSIDILSTDAPTSG